MRNNLVNAEIVAQPVGQQAFRFVSTGTVATEANDGIAVASEVVVRTKDSRQWTFHSFVRKNKGGVPQVPVVAYYTNEDFTTLTPLCAFMSVGLAAKLTGISRDSISTSLGGTERRPTVGQLSTGDRVYWAKWE